MKYTLFTSLCLISTSTLAAPLGVFYFDLGHLSLPGRFGIDMGISSDVVFRGSEELVIFDETLFEFQDRNDRNISVSIVSSNDPDFAAFADRLTNNKNEWINLILIAETNYPGSLYSTGVGNFWESDISNNTDFSGYKITSIELNYFGPLGGEPDGSVVFYGNPVPIPPAVWLFGSGIFSLVIASRKSRS